MCVCMCVCLCVCVCVCVLTIKGGVDIPSLPSFASIRHRNTIIFDRRDTLYLKEPPAKLLKTYLKDNDNMFRSYLRDFNLIKLLLEIKSSFPRRKIIS